MKTFFTVLLLSVLAGCASQAGYGLVVPLQNGDLETSGFGRSEARAMEDALWSAGRECEGHNQRYVVLKRQTYYQGILSDPDQAQPDAKKRTPIPYSFDSFRYELTFRCTPK